MASTSGSNMSSFQTPIFTWNNYEYWSLTMKALFKGRQYVWEIFHNGYAEPTDQTTYNNLTQDGKDTLREHRKKDGSDSVLHTPSHA